ncbi:hypothetical protein QWZ13_01725 [Reinekea marina]|uniref:Phage shock protein B n=1 Tax=Reinekea marina TaxID=1310421 RepID=A0ABV7WSK8_9GAMM|nr:hypothetical protein [Reinekea marina]MDN3647624.1 hypothetical protein [Reinekea marina]
MDIFVFILAIVALGIIGDVVKKHLETKDNDSTSTEDTESRFRELEQRIITLERIVTDQKSQLKEKIDSL